MKRQLSKGLHILFANEQRLDLAFGVIGAVGLICTAIGTLITGGPA